MILRADGATYCSIIDILESLYEKLVPGGLAIVDDYVLLPNRAAVGIFRERRNISEPLRETGWTDVYWSKARS